MNTPARTVAKLRQTVRLLEEATRTAPKIGDAGWHLLCTTLSTYRAALWLEEGLRRESAHQPAQ
jgi:hypothetical protein